MELLIFTTKKTGIGVDKLAGRSSTGHCRFSDHRECIKKRDDEMHQHRTVMRTRECDEKTKHELSSSLAQE